MTCGIGIGLGMLLRSGVLDRSVEVNLGIDLSILTMAAAAAFVLPMTSAFARGSVKSPKLQPVSVSPTVERVARRGYV